jgi:crotonobetainyl-CoA:carnitine CoA-transferase CaiB-like acyl-CoA transferase
MLAQEKSSENMLSGYRVLDLTDEKGLSCGQFLARFGADVIKIEKPGGDLSRNIGPFYHDIPDPEKSLFWFAYNTNKRGITLNIETVDGRQIFKKLVKKADVVIESFNPGYMDELGLGYRKLEKVNPAIVMTSITPFGQTGPYKNYKASDLDCWAMGGSLFACGANQGPPYRVSHIPQAYLDGSANAAVGTVTALYWRRLSGKGQHVDVSIQESVEQNNPHQQVQARLEGSPYHSIGDHYEVRPKVPARVQTTWPAKDGFIEYALFVGETGARFNSSVVNWMKSEGMADDYLINLDWTRFSWEAATEEDVQHLTRLLAAFFVTKTVKELETDAQKWRALITPIYTIKDVRAHPQLGARRTWQDVEHDELCATITYPCRFASLSEMTCEIRRAPQIGEHNKEIYQGELGFSNEEINTFKQAGII